MLNFTMANGDIQGDMVPTANSPKGRNGVPSIRLGKGNALYSPSGGFRLLLQDDGNAVLHCINDAVLPREWKTGTRMDPNTLQWSTPPMWNAGTNDKGVIDLEMQSDGNLVAYSGSGAAWNSNTQNNPGAFLRMQDDGNLVIYGQGGAAIWSTGTYAGGH